MVSWRDNKTSFIATEQVEQMWIVEECAMGTRTKAEKEFIAIKNELESGISPRNRYEPEITQWKT